MSKYSTGHMAPDTQNCHRSVVNLAPYARWCTIALCQFWVSGPLTICRPFLRSPSKVNKQLKILTFLIDGDHENVFLFYFVLFSYFTISRQRCSFPQEWPNVLKRMQGVTKCTNTFQSFIIKKMDNLRKFFSYH